MPMLRRISIHKFDRHRMWSNPLFCPVLPSLQELNAATSTFKMEELRLDPETLTSLQIVENSLSLATLKTFMFLQKLELSSNEHYPRIFWTSVKKLFFFPT